MFSPIRIAIDFNPDDLDTIFAVKNHDYAADPPKAVEFLTRLEPLLQQLRRVGTDAINAMADEYFDRR